LKNIFLFSIPLTCKCSLWYIGIWRKLKYELENEIVNKYNGKKINMEDQKEKTKVTEIEK
jgi:hypothetical protein